MKRRYVSDFVRRLAASIAAIVVVLAATILLLIGRDTLGVGAIALLFLIPVTGSAYLGGLAAGLSAALAAGLCFDFLFIPPYGTFEIGSVEGWLVFAIFLAVAVIVVELIQSALVRAREAVYQFELSEQMAAKFTQEAVARTAAGYLQRLYQALTVQIIYRPGKNAVNSAVSAPMESVPDTRPDRIVPLENAWGLVGEIRLWRGGFAGLPPEDDRLIRRFAAQTAAAFERTRLLEGRESMNTPAGRTAGSPRRDAP